MAKQRMIGPDLSGFPTGDSWDSLSSTPDTALHSGVVTEIWHRASTSALAACGVYDLSSTASPYTGAPLLCTTGEQSVTSGTNVLPVSTPAEVTHGELYGVFSHGSAIGSTQYYNDGSTLIFNGSFAYTGTNPANLPTMTRADDFIRILTVAYGFPAPTITDVDGDDTINVDQEDVVLTGTNLLDDNGNSVVELGNTAAFDDIVVTQTFVSQTDTSITFDVVQGTLSAGTVYARVTTGHGQTVVHQITLAGGAQPGDWDLVSQRAIVSWDMGANDINIVAQRAIVDWLSTPPGVIIGADGDSHFDRYASVMSQLLHAYSGLNEWTITNFAVAGDTVQNIRANWATRLGSLSLSPANDNWAIVEGGVNDLVIGRTDVQLIADIRWCAAQGITDGWDKYVALTVPTGSYATGSRETYRVSVNDDMVSDADNGDYLIADIGGSSTTTPSHLLTDYTNTLVRTVDGVHYTEYGYALIATIIDLVVNNLARVLGDWNVPSNGTNVAANTQILTREEAVTGAKGTKFYVKSHEAGNVKTHVYADDNGSPGALIASNDTPQAVIAGINELTFPDFDIVEGNFYWYGAVADTTGTLTYKTGEHSNWDMVTRAETFSTFTAADPAGSGFAATSGNVLRAFVVGESAGISGSGAAVLQTLVASGAGELLIEGSGSAVLQTLVASGEGELLIEGSGSALLQTLVASGAGELLIEGSGSALLQTLVASGAGDLLIEGSGAAVLQTLIASGAGEVVGTEGFGAAVLQAMVASCEGELLIEGSGGAVLDVLIASGTGTYGIVNIPTTELIKILADDKLIRVGTIRTLKKV